MSWVKLTFCAATLALASCAADGQRRDFSGAFAGVTMAPTSTITHP